MLGMLGCRFGLTASFNGVAAVFRKDVGPWLKKWVLNSRCGSYRASWHHVLFLACFVGLGMSGFGGLGVFVRARTNQQ